MEGFLIFIIGTHLVGETHHGIDLLFTELLFGSSSCVIWIVIMFEDPAMIIVNSLTGGGGFSPKMSQ